MVSNRPIQTADGVNSRTGNRLSIEGVTKLFGSVQALDGVTLELTDGIVGLLGPNGAGKSTLMNILTTVTKPTEGIVRWNGNDIVRDPDTIRSVLGYLPQRFTGYPTLTPEEFLEYVATLRGVPAAEQQSRIDELLTLFNLAEVRNQKLETLSGGTRQRVGIAQALVNDPKLLVVDEPTVGLDPEERARFRNAIAELAADRIVLLSTHIVSDIEATATTIAVVNDGSVLIHETPEALISNLEGRVWSWTIDTDDVGAAKRDHLITGMTRRSDGLHLRVVADEPPVSNATQLNPTLEDAYLALLREDESRAN